jgi:hypothetical protein
VAGGPDAYGYVQISLAGKRWKAHRLAFLYMTGFVPSSDVDHINRDKADNRWANLRPAGRAQNMANMGARRTSKSGIRGVCYTTRGWKAQIKVAGRNRHIGYFGSAEAAGAAYSRAAAEAFGEFAA